MQVFRHDSSVPSLRLRRGLTLLDFLVIIVLIAVLAALLMPALVGPPRWSSRRLQCASNMRQVGLGLIQYLNAYGVFPNAGTYGERPEALPDSRNAGYRAQESIIY